MTQYALPFRPVAALYVETGGTYYGLPGVDPWDVERDARRATRTGACQRLSRKQRLATPPAFRDLLLALARSAWST